MRRFAANTAYHVCMGKGLGSPLVDFGLAHLSGGLRNPGMQRGCPVRDYEVVLVAADWARSAGMRPGSEGRRHDGTVVCRY